MVERETHGLARQPALRPKRLLQPHDWTNPDVWRKANPSFGVTIDEEQFAEDCKEAQESPAKENSFRRYRLNQWTEQDVRWLCIEMGRLHRGPGRSRR
jgi:phage terminase large subunit-like protein